MSNPITFSRNLQANERTKICIHHELLFPPPDYLLPRLHTRIPSVKSMFNLQRIRLNMRFVIPKFVDACTRHARDDFSLEGSLLTNCWSMTKNKRVGSEEKERDKRVRGKKVFLHLPALPFYRGGEKGFHYFFGGGFTYKRVFRV